MLKKFNDFTQSKSNKNPSQITEGKKSKELKNLVSQMEDATEELQSLIALMPDKGLKCSDSQKICLLNDLGTLENTINGIEEEDLEEVVYEGKKLLSDKDKEKGLKKFKESVMKHVFDINDAILSLPNKGETSSDNPMKRDLLKLINAFEAKLEYKMGVTDLYEAKGESNWIDLPGCNLFLVKSGMDVNGNRVIRLTYPQGSTFSLQMGTGALRKTTSILRGLVSPKDMKTISDKDLKIIADEVSEYIQEYGSKKQKSGLKVYGKTNESFQDFMDFAEEIAKEDQEQMKYITAWENFITPLFKKEFNLKFMLGFYSAYGKPQQKFIDKKRKEFDNDYAKKFKNKK